MSNAKGAPSRPNVEDGVLSRRRGGSTSLADWAPDASSRPQALTVGRGVTFPTLIAAQAVNARLPE
jgi:hypothetical protein